VRLFAWVHKQETLLVHFLTVFEGPSSNTFLATQTLTRQMNREGEQNIFENYCFRFFHCLIIYCNPDLVPISQSTRKFFLIPRSFLDTKKSSEMRKKFSFPCFSFIHASNRLCQYFVQHSLYIYLFTLFWHHRLRDKLNFLLFKYFIIYFNLALHQRTGVKFQRRWRMKNYYINSRSFKYLQLKVQIRLYLLHQFKMLHCDRLKFFF
jgi:hypothetical protein